MLMDEELCSLVAEASADLVCVGHRVEYDVGAVIQAIERSRHPSGGFIISHFRGERRQWWAGARDGQESAFANPPAVGE
jgi:hypothetical protein